MISVLRMLYEVDIKQLCSSSIHKYNIVRGGFNKGGHHPLALHIFTLEPYICPYANTCLKISSCIDIKCLLYVCVTVKIQFGNTLLNHTCPSLGRYAFLHVWAPLFQNSRSAPDCSR